VVRIHSGALRILRPHRYLAVWPFCVAGGRVPYAGTKRTCNLGQQARPLSGTVPVGSHNSPDRRSRQDQQLQRALKQLGLVACHGVSS
jgi:hypothetical protein